MDRWYVLVNALREEDRLLRRGLAVLPRSARESVAQPHALSFKETLGHIAFWDGFTVEFFRCKLDLGSRDMTPPDSFEESNREALERSRTLPFGEVLARYLESTGALLEFLQTHWDELTLKEKRNFRVPLKHRRHHRILLFEGMGLIPTEEPAEDLAAGA